MNRPCDSPGFCQSLLAPRLDSRAGSGFFTHFMNLHRVLSEPRFHFAWRRAARSNRVERVERACGTTIRREARCRPFAHGGLRGVLRWLVARFLQKYAVQRLFRWIFTTQFAGGDPCSGYVLLKRTKRLDTNGVAVVWHNLRCRVGWLYSQVIRWLVCFCKNILSCPLVRRSCLKNRFVC